MHMKNLPRKGRGQGQVIRFRILHHVISLQQLMLETSNFVHGSAIWSLSLVMSESFLSGVVIGHVSNFYIVDLENFATASRRYVQYRWCPQLDCGQFVYHTYRTMKATRSRHGRMHMFITHRPTVTLQLHDFYVVSSWESVAAVSFLLQTQRIIGQGRYILKIIFISLEILFIHCP